MAIGAMAALRDAGLSVPGDVAVTGFDGIQLGRHLRPSLTTVVQPMAALGDTAVAMLKDRIGGAALPQRTVELPVRLELRGSCGCPELGGGRQGGLWMRLRARYLWLVAAVVVAMLVPGTARAAGYQVSGYDGLSPAQRASLLAVARDTWKFCGTDVDQATSLPMDNITLAGMGLHQMPGNVWWRSWRELPPPAPFADCQGTDPRSLGKNQPRTLCRVQHPGPVAEHGSAVLAYAAPVQLPH